jgi:hypothetical protein
LSFENVVEEGGGEDSVWEVVKVVVDVIETGVWPSAGTYGQLELEADDDIEEGGNAEDGCFTGHSRGGCGVRLAVDGVESAQNQPMMTIQSLCELKYR